MTALSHDVLVSCMVALGVLLIFFHIRAEVEGCQSILSWCLRALRYATSHQQAEKESKEEAMQFRRMVEQVRVQNFMSIMRLCTFLTGLIVTCHSFIHLQNQENHKYSGVLSWLLLVYAVCLFISYSNCQWTSVKVKVVMILFNLVLLVRTCIIQDRRVWFLAFSNRAMFRLWMGIMDLDHRAVFAWNLLFGVVNCVKTAKMSESLPALQRPIGETLINEVIICMLLWSASYIAQMWVTEGVRTAYQASKSRIDKTMTDHLLAAFCDAQIKLGSDLQLVGSHDKLDQILLVNSPAGSELLHDTSFLDYLASADKTRFKAFIEASSATSDQCSCSSSGDLYERPKTLPSALHVHLCDSLGRHLPASIFHSAINADGESHHLIGICIDSSVEFTGEQQTPTDSAEPANEGSQADQNFRSLSSRSSSVSNRSKGSLRLVDLPSIERVSITFDPFEWSIRKISWHLWDAGDQVPKVHDCMVQPGEREFRDWVQQQVSMVLLAQGEGSDQEGQSEVYGSLTMALPQWSDSKKIFICAKSAWLDLEDLDDGENAMVSLQLEGVQKISGAGRMKAGMLSIRE